MERLDASPTNFQAVQTIAEALEGAGFRRLLPEEAWSIERGGKYYMTKNDSAIFAVIAGRKNPSEAGFHIISSHSDSPGFKIKPNAEIYGDGGVVSLNVEKYGGAVLSTWFDRPLSIAGRVMARGKDALHPVTHLVDFRRPVCTIPNLAIHFNRQVNDGYAYSVQKDMKPVMGYFDEEEISLMKSEGGLVKSMLGRELGVDPKEIIDYELSLYPVVRATLTGVNEEYLQSPRIDDLSMAFTSLEALLQTADEETDAWRVMAVFDNEETGSGTKQGAHSPVLRSLMERCVALAEGEERERFLRAVANSFMISADDAHAWHPNYSEKYDPTNHPVIGGGPVVKINANCKYMTDADGSAVFRELCREAGVDCQYFVNHSDVAGGSTLGNILTGQLDLRGVDMGCAIWAMHSAVETGGVADHEATACVFARFYSC